MMANDEFSDTQSIDFDRPIPLLTSFDGEAIQPDMLRTDEGGVIAITPLPGRRLSELSEERRAILRKVLDQFGLEPTETIWPRLNRAFIHRSYRTEASIDEDNERLEFLGDSVIGLICTEYILRLFPERDEGLLSKLRATIVSRVVLGQIAQSMNLGEALLLSSGEDRSGGRQRPNLLGSTLEAVCGVLYLHYPWDRIREPITRCIIMPGFALAKQNTVADYKSALQEWAQKLYKVVPEYRTVLEDGPDHSKNFVIEVWVGNDRLGVGRGSRKKIAENNAAQNALEAMQSQRSGQTASDKTN